MKWWAWSVPRRYWCHDSAITGSFGVDTSYAKIPHRHLTSHKWAVIVFEGDMSS